MTDSSNSHSEETNQSSEQDMKINFTLARAAQLISNISSIRRRITEATQQLQPQTSQNKQVRLVAVSKLKPASDILALHKPSGSTDTSSEPSQQSQAQDHFGENYVQELLEKSRLLPRSIKWHFIGGLQSNKCLQLARDVPNLWAVESVDSIKKARLLQKGRAECQKRAREENQDQEGVSSEEPLRVFVQVNTSGEDSKSGVSPPPPLPSLSSGDAPTSENDLVDLCKHIYHECPNLKLQGLMTIGAIARSKATTAETENEDFVVLREARDYVVEKLMDRGEQDGKELELELSMGMSEDFEGAIMQGSDEVRVGSTIFGERPPKSEAKVLENTEEEKK